MEEKTISFRQGKGSLTHNNRTFIAENVHKERIKDNVTFISQPIQEAYQQLFSEATLRHNSQQKRNDRKFDDYYQHLFKHDYSNNVIQSSNGEKSFYEDIMQIGTMKDTGCGTPDAETAKACLIEYMENFQSRNPNFYVFNAVLHMDEATPHLHFDYIPVGHCEGKKLDTRNSISKALEEMGFGKGKQAIARWREREWGIMKQICINHDIQIAKPEKPHKYMEVEEYKEFMDRIEKSEELAVLNAEIEAEIQEKKEQRNHILNYLPDFEKTERLESELNDLCDELENLVKNPISAVKNKKRIGEICSDISKRLISAHRARDKSENTVYEVRAENKKFSEENKKLRNVNQSLSSENSKLKKQISALEIQGERNSSLVETLKKLSPQAYQQIEAVADAEARKIQQEQAQIYQQQPKKKKSFERE